MRDKILDPYRERDTTIETGFQRYVTSVSPLSRERSRGRSQMGLAGRKLGTRHFIENQALMFLSVISSDGGQIPSAANVLGQLSDHCGSTACLTGSRQGGGGAQRRERRAMSEERNPSSNATHDSHPRNIPGHGSSLTWE